MNYYDFPFTVPSRHEKSINPDGSSEEGKGGGIQLFPVAYMNST